MDTVEVEKHETPIVFVAFLTRIAAVAALITVAAWLIANVALDWLGAPFLK
jgi:hypothetical protein